jgi:ribonuclease E
MKKEMLINVLQPEECRIAILEDGILEELYVERTSQESYVGNIYKGRIVNIEPSIQAAFVDFGIGRNGFLHVSDVEPAYYRHLEPRRYSNGGRRHDRGSGRSFAAPHGSDQEDLTTLPLAGEEAETGVSEQRTGPSGHEHRRDNRERRGSKNGGRGRGRGRRRRGPREVREEFAAADVPVEETPVSEDIFFADSPSPELPQEHLPGEAQGDGGEDDRPRYMDSAERRTENGQEEDEDIFFPRPTPESSHEPTAQQKRSHDEETPLIDHDREPKDSPPAGTGGAPALEEHFPSDVAREEESGFPESAPVTEAMFEHERAPDEEERRAHPEEREDFESSGAFSSEEGEHYRPRPRRPQRDDRRGRGRRPMSGRPGAGRPKPLIQDIFRRGQEVLVQVIKEGIGTKGPTLSTYISIAGRYLVLMPGLNRVGVSRKIADDDQRRRLRDIFHELQPPRGLGFIIRTAGIDKTKKELQRDLAYLARLWQVVVRRIRKLKGPTEIYQESDMITRTIRDTFTSDIDTIWVDEPAAHEHAAEFLQIVMPRYASRIKLYADSEPLFHKHGIEEEIARIQQRHVPLPNGGSIVIDQTEALVAIDVNSGNFRADNNAEETAYQMNLLAAREIARQLRLRDLGGVIVNDFIDMRDEKHRRNVERALRDAVKRDRARTKILRISQFGLIEMTRQRIRPSLKRSVYQDCPYCRGTSQVKTCESMSIDVMRLLQLAAHRQNVQRVQVRVHEDVAGYLLNRKRKEITRLEESGEIQVTITSALNVPPESLDFVCYDNNNNEIKFLPFEETRPQRR